MDPYLEDRSLWPDVHHDFISQFRSGLASKVLPNYIVRIEERIFPIGEDDPAVGILIPDIALHAAKTTLARSRSEIVATAPSVTAPILIMDKIREAYLEIRTLKGERIVTVIEVLSPSNKVAGSSPRNAYLGKRRRWLNSESHFVEIDLLRGGERVNPVGVRLPTCDYRVIISRVEMRPLAHFWQVKLRDTLPVIPVPLLGDDPPATMDLGQVLNEVYDRARYDIQIDYSSDPPAPELTRENRKWLRSQLSAK